MSGLTMGARMKMIAAKARAFAWAKRGNVAMMFGLAMVPIVIGAGVGLDYARAMLVRQQMSEALDAAALAVGSTTGLNAATAQDLAQKYFNANFTVDQTAFGTPTIQPPVYNANGSVALTANDAMPTILMSIVGINSVPVSTTSTVVWGQTKLWVALVLDNSGSMCDPDSQPCVNDSNTSSKIYQLKSATNTMLTSLQGVSTTPGDVEVAIVPFNREVDVGIGDVGASWISWTFWGAAPANSGIVSPDLQGPSDACPWSTGSQGYTCQTSATNGSSTTSSIPSSGLICPSIDNGSFNADRNDNYYNGCYTSAATGNTKQVSSGKNSTCGSYHNCTCTGSSSSSSRHCDAKYYNHVWTTNLHSTWGGCLTDRLQDYDISNTTPVGSSSSTGMVADNPANPVSATNCMYGNVTPLEDSWSDLATQVSGMQAKGSTNQAIGIANGWQALTPGDPYGAPTVPANTTRYIILLSDGLNTQDKWWGDGSTENTSDDAKIDARENLVCSAAKADGVVIYTIYVHVNGAQASTSIPLQNCATDSTKYYNLTSSSQIAAAFADITKQITNVRVSH
jgi:Flp pilus assembly protein TadG